jgi:glycosyltransferase involved in cell wall biosynthesis
VRVALETSVLLFDRGGSARYVAQLRDALRDSAGCDVVDINMHSSWPWTARLDRRLQVLLHDLAWIPFGASRAARRAGADLLHCGAFKAPPWSGPPVTVVVHDDSPWDPGPAGGRPWNRNYIRLNLRLGARRITGVFCGTRHSGEEVAARLHLRPGRLFVTPYGIDHQRFRTLPDGEVASMLEKLGVKRPYALLVSPYGARKNLGNTRAALALVRRSHPDLATLIVGTSPALAPEPGRESVLGRVDDDQLTALYNGAAVFVMASLKEGFGFPVLEAMACGCPVVVSAGTCLEEVGGDAALSAPPDDPAAIAAAIERALDPSGREERVKAGLARAATFTWQATATATVRAWEAVLAGDQERTPA